MNVFSGFQAKAVCYVFECGAVCLNVPILNLQRTTADQGTGSSVPQSTAGHTAGTPAVSFAGQRNVPARPMVRSVYVQCSSEVRTEVLSVKGTASVNLATPGFGCPEYQGL